MGRVVWVGLLGMGLYVVIRHHAGYLYRHRRMTFAAFLGTGGWIVLSLVAIAAIAGAWNAPETRVVELVAGAIGTTLVGVGWRYA